MSRGRGLIVVLALLVGLLVAGYVPRPLTGQTRAIVLPNDGVPRGFSLLGDTPESPPGYTVQGSTEVGESWTVKADMPTPRYNCGASLVASAIYVIGGMNYNDYLNANERYDPITDTWQIRAPLPTVRTLTAVVAADEKIYVIGGWIAGQTLAVNERYDPAVDEWSTLAQMPTPRRGQASAAVNGKIYVLAGTNAQNNWTRTNEVFDPSTNSWQSRASIPSDFSGGITAASANGKVYLFGYSQSLKNYRGVAEYDPASDSWTMKTPSIDPVIAATAVADGSGRIYAFFPEQASPSGEYDTITDSWRRRDRVPIARSGVASASFGEDAFLFGGTDQGGATSRNERFSLPRVYYVHRRD